MPGTRPRINSTQHAFPRRHATMTSAAKLRDLQPRVLQLQRSSSLGQLGRQGPGGPLLSQPLLAGGCCVGDGGARGVEELAVVPHLAQEGLSLDVQMMTCGVFAGSQSGSCLLGGKEMCCPLGL